eukprot:3244741-Karenia_brevis.AAC.1
MLALGEASEEELVLRAAHLFAIHSAYLRVHAQGRADGVAQAIAMIEERWRYILGESARVRNSLAKIRRMG